MKLLVTGSSGHLGEAIVRMLQNSEHAVVGLDRKPGAFTSVVGSITDSAFVEETMQGVEMVIHTATLHKPHIVTHSYQDFVDTNITGTLNLLEASVKVGVRAFIYTSTTSTFGDTLSPDRTEPAAWITEASKSIPKNIYGVTKTAAEDLCQLFYRKHQLSCLVLKTSRFFPEEDDKAEIRKRYSNDNLKANELLYRRVDLEDAAEAHLLAIDRAEEIGFAKYIISATTPFTKAHLSGLRQRAPEILEELYPKYKALYQAKNWQMFTDVDRVYINEKARQELGWKPKYDFEYLLDCLEQGKDFKSQLSLDVGVKGYHKETFDEGPYPVD